MSGIKNYVFESYTSVNEMLNIIFKDIDENKLKQINVNNMILEGITELEDEDYYVQKNYSIDVNIEAEASEIEDLLNEFVHEMYRQIEIVKFSKINRIINNLCDTLEIKESECEHIKTRIYNLVNTY